MRIGALLVLSSLFFSFSALSVPGMATYSNIQICNQSNSTLKVAILDSQMLSHGDLYFYFGEQSAGSYKSVDAGKCIGGNVTYRSGFYDVYKFSFGVYDTSKNSKGVVYAALFTGDWSGMKCRELAKASDSYSTGSLTVSFTPSNYNQHCHYYSDLTITITGT